MQFASYSLKVMDVYKNFYRKPKLARPKENTDAYDMYDSEWYDTNANAIGDFTSSPDSETVSETPPRRQEKKIYSSNATQTGTSGSQTQGTIYGKLNF